MPRHELVHIPTAFKNQTSQVFIRLWHHGCRCVLKLTGTCTNLFTFRNTARAPIFEHLPRSATAAVGSGQAILQHTESIDYGCFLPDLTGFADVPLSRTQPSTPRSPYLTKEQDALEWEFNPAKADFGFKKPLTSRLARAKSELFTLTFYVWFKFLRFIKLELHKKTPLGVTHNVAHNTKSSQTRSRYFCCFLVIIWDGTLPEEKQRRARVACMR